MRADTPESNDRRQGRGVTYLVTGGAGFIGSHLADALTARGGHVVVLDDLGTGRLENIGHLTSSGRAEFVEGSVRDKELVVELLEATDGCVHLASAVGVKLVVDRPVETLLQSVRGTDTVLFAAAGVGRRALFASTSEIYGKSAGTPLSEESDRLLGSTTKTRWNYSTSKAFGEALALGHHRELDTPTVVVRLFNTVGPRQRSSRNGPAEVRPPGARRRGPDRLRGRHADALLRARIRGSGGSRVGSSSAIRLVPYADAYEDGFEELGRRVPDTTAVRELTGWAPTRSIDDAIDDVIMFERATDLQIYTESLATDRSRFTRFRDGGAQVG
jgi:nucleoside-diphosphate-sugar epimerase